MSTLREFSGTLVLVGAGKMGGAMLEGWLALGLDPTARSRSATRSPLLRSRRWKPKACASIRRRSRMRRSHPRGETAGRRRRRAAAEGADACRTPSRCRSWRARRIAFLKARSGQCAIVRSIPNTPAAIGRGITVAVPNAKVSGAQRALADALLRSVGAVEWVDDEALIDAATAVSGSGPAYVFLLAESLARAGASAGLPADLAARLARATVAGSGELLHRSPLDAATLRQNVTSPGGTTAAALSVLMASDGLDPLMKKAVAAATKRSRELAG